MTTTKNSMPLSDDLRKLLTEGSGDFLREAMIAVLKEFMEAQIAQLVGAARHERSDDRQDQRNGFRERRFDTRVGTIDLEVPRLRKGNYMPSFLEPRSRAEEALLNVIQEAYVHGVSTRKVADLLRAMGLAGISKSEVSRICKALDEQVEAFRNRPLTQRYPYLWLDATYLKVREGGRVVSNAVVVAYAVNDEGYREVIGVSVGASETESFWTEFLRGLVARGLGGVQLVTSDAHQGLKAAIAAVLTGTSWQRCMVHFLRNVDAKVAKAAQGMVGASVRTIFSQPDLESGRWQLARTAEMLQDKCPQVAEMLWDSEEDLLAHMHFPEAHRKQIRSTNCLERLNKEIKRRSDVVGIFPNPASALRLIGMVLNEQNDEWMASAKRYMSLESLAAFKLKVLEGYAPALPAPEPTQAA